MYTIPVNPKDLWLSAAHLCIVGLLSASQVYFTELAFDLQHKHPQKDFSSVLRSWGGSAQLVWICEADTVDSRTEIL